MQIVLHKEVRTEPPFGACWTVCQGGRSAGWITWDEMLGALVRVALTGWSIPDNRHEDELDQYLASAYGRQYTLTITKVEQCGLWTIQRNDRFIDRLTFDEMLGFTAAYTLDGRELFGGFMSYEQWAKRDAYYRRRRGPVEITGLLK